MIRRILVAVALPAIAGCSGDRNRRFGRDGDPQFVALEQPEFWLVPGPANALQFNRILAAAGFRCNVQESGVSCQSEQSGKGFTFSEDGYTPQYTDVPANAP